MQLEDETDFEPRDTVEWIYSDFSHVTQADICRATNFFEDKDDSHWQVSDASIIMVTMSRDLKEDEVRSLQSGTKFLERFTLGLYAPEFSNKRSEVDLKLDFDKGTV